MGHHQKSGADAGAAMITDVYGVSGQLANWRPWRPRKKKAREEIPGLRHFC
jgi:hypothetical protein